MIKLQQIIDLIPALHQPNQLRRNSVLAHHIRDDPMQTSVRLHRLLPTLQQQTIPRPNRQGSDLRQRIGPCLENDQQHSDGRRHLLQIQPVRDLHLT